MKPSRQLCAQWVVDAWDKIPESLIRKAWDLCGYKKVSELNNGSEYNGDVVDYSAFNENTVEMELQKAVEEDQAMQIIEFYNKDIDNHEVDQMSI